MTTSSMSYQDIMLSLSCHWCVIHQIHLPLPYPCHLMSLSSHVTIHVISCHYQIVIMSQSLFVIRSYHCNSIIITLSHNFHPIVNCIVISLLHLNTVLQGCLKLCSCYELLSFYVCHNLQEGNFNATFYFENSVILTPY